MGEIAGWQKKADPPATRKDDNGEGVRLGEPTSKTFGSTSRGLALLPEEVEAGRVVE